MSESKYSVTCLIRNPVYKVNKQDILSHQLNIHVYYYFNLSNPDPYLSRLKNLVLEYPF